jgi:hypothetical protein
MLLSSERTVRLMGLFNIKARLLNGEATGQFLCEGAANVDGAPVVQWVPSGENVPVEVVLPDATTQAGLAETGLKMEHVGAILQFVRYGFGRVDKVSSEKMIVYFAHQ